MSDSISQSDNFNGSNNSASSSNFAEAIVSDAFGSKSVAIIALIVVNFFAAILAIIVIVSDNRRVHRTWAVTPSRRIPLSLAFAVTLSHVVFILKAFNGLEVSLNGG